MGLGVTFFHFCVGADVESHFPSFHFVVELVVLLGISFTRFAFFQVLLHVGGIVAFCHTGLSVGTVCVVFQVPFHFDVVHGDVDFVLHVASFPPFLQTCFFFGKVILCLGWCVEGCQAEDFDLAFHLDFNGGTTVVAFQVDFQLLVYLG